MARGSTLIPLGGTYKNKRKRVFFNFNAVLRQGLIYFTSAARKCTSSMSALGQLQHICPSLKGVQGLLFSSMPLYIICILYLKCEIVKYKIKTIFL